MIETVKRVASVLAAEDIPFALTGGFAVYARGGSLSEHDVDFLIRETDVPRIIEALREDGLRMVEPPEDWLVKAYDDDILVDLIHRPVQEPVTDDTLADSDVLAVGGSHMPVMSGAVLMAHKILSLNAHRCDMAPALELARLLREQIDWERVRKEASDSPYAGAFLYLVTELGICPPPPDAEVTA